MIINHNLMAMNTHRQLGMNNMSGQKSIEKLSSGFRINRAGDDAAGLAISEKMRGQIRGLSQASRNSQDAISLIQTAEGALNETHAILQRMRELAVQSASDTNVEKDRSEIQKEINQLTSEINRIGNTTEFNTMKLVNGDRAAAGSVTKVTQELATAAAKDLAFAEGVNHNGYKFALKDDKVTITNTHSGWAGVASGTGTVSIEKVAGDKLQITINSPSSGQTPLVVVDTIKLDQVSNSFKYDAHGISFELSAEEYQKTAVGDKVDLTITAAEITAGAKTTANDFTTNVLSGGGTNRATVSGLSVTPMSGWTDVRSMDVTWDGTKLTVILKDADGTTLNSDDTITWSGAAAYTYNEHGISFKVDRQHATEFSFSTTFDTETKSVTEDRADNSLKFQVGANESQAMMLDMGDMRSVALGISSQEASANFSLTKAVTDGTNNTAAEYALNVSTHEAAARSITIVNNAIETVSSERSKLGAVQNRLEHTIKNLDTSAENLQAAEARIRDVDMAKEMMEFTKNNILQQAATAMLAQANQAPQAVLQLLR